MQLQNRTILVTGGASGIGLALARRLVAGNRVIVCGRNRDKLERIGAEIPSIETFRCDINDANDLNDLVSFLGTKYLDLDTLINNAGIQQQLDLTGDEVTNLDVAREIDTNLTAQIIVTRRLYPLLSANEKSVIVFTGSALGLVPKFDVPVYSAAKAGLHSFVQSLRHQAGMDGVDVHEIFPEIVRTPMTEHRFDENLMDADVFADEVLRQLRQGKRDIFVGRTGKLYLLNRLLPGMALRVMNKAGPN